MAYKKGKEKMSREELENRLEWLQVENNRLKRDCDKLCFRLDEAEAKYNALPPWMRRLAEKRYGRKTK